MNDSANRTDLVTFLTDFGLTGGEYVAACEAVMASLAPTVRVLHTSHEIGVGDIRWGARVLSRVAPLAPPCIHLAVVDPGVGTARRPLILVANRGDRLVGPDNGLLIPATEALGGPREAWLIDEDRLRARAGLAGGTVSATFHGRDIFAPAAALLAAGAPVADIARPHALDALVRLEPAVVDITPTGIVAEVVEVDRFGNVGLAAHFDDWAFASTSVTVEVIGEDLPDWNAHVVQTFGQLGSGDLGVYRDSWGHLALALNGASAAQLLSVDRGTMIRISPQGAE